MKKTCKHQLVRPFLFANNVTGKLHVLLQFFRRFAQIFRRFVAFLHSFWPIFIDFHRFYTFLSIFIDFLSIFSTSQKGVKWAIGVRRCCCERQKFLKTWFYHLQTLESCRGTSQLSVNIFWASRKCLKLQKFDFF